MTSLIRPLVPLLAPLLLLVATVPASAQPQPQEPARMAAPVDEAPPVTAAGNAVLEALRPAPGGLSADAAVRQALERSPVIRRANAVAEGADASATGARLGMWPRLDLSARYTRLSHVDQPPLVFNGTEIENIFPQILNTYGLRATLTVPVTDIFLTIGPSATAARHLADAARWQAEGQREAVASQVRGAFYGLLQARGAQVVARTAIDLLEALVRDLDELSRAGVVARTDLIRAQAQLASARVALARATGAVESTETVLRRLVGLPMNAPVRLAEDLTASSDFRVPNAQSVVTRAMQQRAEAHALRAVIAGREGFISAQRARGWPRLLLSANLDYANPNQRIVPSLEEFRGSWDASAIAQWSPNDLATSGRDVVAARSELEQARQDLAALEDGIAIEAAQAIAEYNASTQAIDASDDGVAAAAESYRARREIMAAGAATASEVLDAQTQLARAQLEQILALTGERLARARLLQVVGESAPRNQGSPAESGSGWNGESR